MLKFIAVVCVLAGVAVGGYFLFFRDTTTEDNDPTNQDETQAVNTSPQDVALAYVPKEVLEAVRKKYPNVKHFKAKKLIEEGKTLFNVSFNHKNEDITVTLTSSGKIEEISKEIDDRDVPKEVKDALEARYPKSTIEDREEVYSDENDEEPDHYRFKLLTSGKKTLEVTVNPDGTSLTEMNPTAETTTASEPKDKGDGKKHKKDKGRS